MNGTSNRIGLGLQVLITIILFSSVLTLGYYYKNAGDKAAPSSEFYKNLPVSHFSWPEDRLRDILVNGTGDSYEDMVVDSAYLRYYLNSKHPGIFHKYMESYSHGLWSLPDEATWVGIFSDFTGNWKGKRAAFLKTGITVSRPAIRKSKPLELLFEPGSTTFMLGSKFDIFVAIPSKDVTDQPAEAMYTIKTTGNKIYQEIDMAKWKLNTETSGTQTVGVLQLDYGGDPQWLRDYQTLISLAITGDKAEQWQIVGVRYY